MEWKTIFWPGPGIESVIFWLMLAGVSFGFMVLVRVVMIIARPDPDLASLFTRAGFGIALMGLIEAGLMWTGLALMDSAYWPIVAIIAYTHIFISIGVAWGVCSLIPGFFRIPQWAERLIRLSADK